MLIEAKYQEFYIKRHSFGSLNRDFFLYLIYNLSGIVQRLKNYE